MGETVSFADSSPFFSFPQPAGQPAGRSLVQLALQFVFLFFAFWRVRCCSGSSKLRSVLPGPAVRSTKVVVHTAVTLGMQLASAWAMSCAASSAGCLVFYFSLFSHFGPGSLRS